MVKTKRTVKKVSTVQELPKKGKTCDGACWLCWLFKIMIALFIIMVVFWLGFCFGALSAYSPSAVIRPGSMSYGTNPAPAVPGQSDIFENDFINQMILQHQEAIDMAKLGLEKTTNEGIKSLCQTIIDSHTKELNELEAIQVVPTGTALPQTE